MYANHRTERIDAHWCDECSVEDLMEFPNPLLFCLLLISVLNDCLMCGESVQCGHF
jgi:hypothetical protein